MVGKVFWLGSVYRGFAVLSKRSIGSKLLLAVCGRY